MRIARKPHRLATASRGTSVSRVPPGATSPPGPREKPDPWGQDPWKGKARTMTTTEERLDKLERSLGNLEFRIREGEGHHHYLFVRRGKGYSAFREMVAKEAARRCGAKNGDTRQMCKRVWDKQEH